MPVLRQFQIFRDDLRGNRHVLYVFGDNEAREGLGGQAKAMRGEPNAVGIRTKRSPSTAPEAYWSDLDFEKNCAMIDEDLKRVRTALSFEEIVVIPLDGIGTGLARLEDRAPRTFAYLQECLNDLE